MTDDLSRIHNISKGLEVIEPFAYAEILAKEHVIPADKKAEAVAIIMATPASMFLYNGVRLLLQKILYAGSDVVLWTQGDPTLQNAKCETSGLLQLTDEKHGSIEIAAATEKISLLPTILTLHRLKNKKRIIFIDDKAPQLFKTYQEIINLSEIEHKHIPEDIAYIWVRQDKKTSEIYPTGFTDMQELTKFMENKFTSLSKIENMPVYANSLYLIDFDRTLLDTDKWFSIVQHRIITEVARA